MPYLLGKQPKRTDSRTLQLARYLTPDLPPPPAAVDNGSAVTDWGMLGNDTAGDCAWAAQAHADLLWSAAAQHKELVDQHEPGAARLRAGHRLRPQGRPARCEPDRQGHQPARRAVLLAAHGIDRKKITAYVEVDATDIDHVKSAIDLFGCAYVGVQLPDAVLPTEQGVPQWTVSPDGSAARRPNPANGHCIVYSAYDAHGVTVVTWGMTVQASWAFHTAYCDEIYAALSHLWFGRSADPRGLNEARAQRRPGRDRALGGQEARLVVGGDGVARTLAFGDVLRLVGCLEQLGRAQPPARCRQVGGGDPAGDAAADAEVVGGLDHPGGDREDRRGRVTDHDDAELVAADPGDQRAGQLGELLDQAPRRSSRRNRSPSE